MPWLREIRPDPILEIHPQTASQHNIEAGDWVWIESPRGKAKDNDLCIGCRECLEACPFGAMQFEDTQEIAVKCDLCVHRLTANKHPACMAVCATGCIYFDGKKSVAGVFERTSRRGA